jgi:hypothetical protein
MPGQLLHLGATVFCQHGGQAMPVTPFPRVRVSGQPILLQTTPYTIVGCSFVPPAGNGPCITAQWTTAALRVKANGIPVLLSDSQALCVPTSTGLNVAVVQPRVKGV